MIFREYINGWKIIMKFNKDKRIGWRWLLPVLIFVLGGSSLYFFNKYMKIDSYDKLQTKAKLNAVTYSDRMVEELNKGIEITNTLKHCIISQNGKLDRFDDVADSMMTDYVQSIQLAPKGVVKQIYPEKGNEAGKIDLVHDKMRGEIVRYGIKKHLVIMQGPFKLNQGGSGIAIRNPIYLKKSNGETYFWGLTIVIIKVPEIFSDSVKSLSEFGYRYRLYKTESPLSSKFELIDGSKEKPSDSVYHLFTLGGCVWKLDVMPKNGWVREDDIVLMKICEMLILLLLEGLVIAILILTQQHKKLKRLATTDGMTGLYNRTGFNEHMESYLDGAENEKCVGILLDIDNFKLINDMYGHDIGDNVLKHLAETMKKYFPNDSIIGRNGGDEFCIILKGESASEAKTMIEKFCRQERILKYKGKEYSYSISVGYAEYPLQTKRGSQLIHFADIALYEVKLNGKNNCMLYDENICSEKRTQLGFKLNDVSINLPGAFFIYRADKQNEEILYANEEMIQMAGCDDLDDFYQFTGQQFCNLVHPDEVKQVEESIWRQISSNENKANDYVQYRMATKNGSYIDVIDFGRIVENEYYGKVFYVLLVDCAYIKKYYEMN